MYTNVCKRDGMKHALASDKKLYTLEGHEAELSKLAGQRVTVKGTTKNGAVTVQSVAAAK
jgi:hypothetical protein